MPRARISARVFGLTAIVLTASLAAVLAHVAIDVAGDFVLPHDTYDRIAHHSRLVALAVAAVLGAGSFLTVLAAGFSDARRYRGALRALVRSRITRSTWGFVGLVAAAALPALIAMESVDAFVESGRLPDFAAALGGSIPLGLATLVTLSITLGWALWRTLKIVDASHRRIASALERLITRREATDASHVASCELIAPENSPARVSVLARRAGKRAPPLAA
jgi:hypothetical protein